MCTSPVEELPVTGSIAFSHGLISLPALRLFFFRKGDFDIMLHARMSNRPLLASTVQTPNRDAHAGEMGPLFFKKTVEHKAQVVVGEDTADTEDRTTSTEVRAKIALMTT